MADHVNSDGDHDAGFLIQLFTVARRNGPNVMGLTALWNCNICGYQAATTVALRLTPGLT